MKLMAGIKKFTKQVKILRYKQHSVSAYYKALPCWLRAVIANRDLKSISYKNKLCLSEERI